MDFTLDTEQQALRDAVREMAGRLTADEHIGAPRLDTGRWQALAEMGVLVDEGIGPIEEMVIAEELGRAHVVVPYAETVLTTAVLRAAGNDDLLATMAEGKAVVVPALAEPGRAWGTRPATGFADDAVTGVKDPVPYADGATHLVVDTEAGLALVEAPTIAGSTAHLEGAAATLLTEEPAVLEGALARATVALCAEALGAMQTALDLTVDYLKTRKQFGVPLMTFQTLTQRAADLYVELELARSIVQYAAMTMADDDATVEERVATASRAKVVVGKAGRLIGQEAIQMHGGIGMTAEYAVGHLTARLTAIEHTWGDTRQHVAALASQVGEHRAVEVI
ncbi:acyl-CoA dehydrogenase family protein [Nocardioides sp.]|uniref:acyl-CoA dehydrogenase family protein n=1 Tax=Nocardioides sp. TaxID=35761 RepID=UPI002732FA26|nr:acyl-CoA dehydrogenase family protein [Nocardioides sp.]MDP3894275.1 acyl-CoA dehydrogenase family protein [Nocardioides sp.]